MAKTTPDTPPAQTPAPRASNLTEADRAWVKQEIAAALKKLAEAARIRSPQ